MKRLQPLVIRIGLPLAMAMSLSACAANIAGTTSAAINPEWESVPYAMLPGAAHPSYFGPTDNIGP